MSSLAQIDDFLASMGGSYAYMPPTFERHRFFALGESKVGKSYAFARWGAGVVQADIEGKAHSVEGRTTIRIPIGDDPPDAPDRADPFKIVNRLDKFITGLEKKAKAGEYPVTHVVFDSADKLQEVIYRKIERENGKDFLEVRGGRGAWGELANRTVGFAQRVYALGIGWTMISHLVMGEKEDTNISNESTGEKLKGLRPQLTPKTSGLITNDAEYILIFNRVQRLDKTDGKKKDFYEVHTQRGKGSRALFPVGGTVELPPVITIPVDGGMATIAKLFNEKVETIKQKENK